MTSPPSANTSPLQAAQKIVAELEGMGPEHQSLALRFAIETLGLRLPAGSTTTPTATVPSHQPASTPETQGAEHSNDIRSFTTMKAPQSDQQFTAVVAYFYKFEAKEGDRKETIDAEVMREAARLAGRPQVTRWRMTLTNAKNAGYLDAVGSGDFRLSSVGENLVAITLPGGGAVPRGNGATKKAKKATAKKVAKRKK